MKTKTRLLWFLIATSHLFVCAQNTEPSRFTKQANEQVLKTLPFDNKQDFEDATQGFIATIDEPAITGENGKEVYGLAVWDFLKQEAPASANPSLWRQGQLNRIHGLFEVLPGKIYQIRGFDLANMTFVRSDNGWIVIDVLLSKETALAGYNLLKKHVADLPVKAVIYTHPHVDHFAGIDAILENAPNQPNSIEIIGPKGFFEEAVSENLMAGVAMGRRATYMYGRSLPKNEKGNIGTGLGQTTAVGTSGLVPPTREISEEGETLRIDGVEIDFMSVPGAEAPVEIMMYFPEMKAFCVAEEINHNLHNLLTLRGAKVRNGQLWSKYIDKAIVKCGDQVEVSFSTHHWPTWGNKQIVGYWEKQRDLYRYLHDQTLHLANQGYTPREIAEMIKLPGAIANEFANRGYYGTVSHNVKAQYQMYFGWFDGIPANLNPLPPTEEGKKYVEAIGGEEAVMEKAKEAYNQGEYRWTATLLNNLVFANPNHKAARQLLADTYSQLGYQAESGPWRNFYLTGAQELTNGIAGKGKTSSNIARMSQNLSLEMLFDMLAIQINGEKAADKDIIINVSLTDAKEQATLILKNGALSNRIGILHAAPTVSLKGDKQTIYTSFTQPESIMANMQAKKLSVTGRLESLKDLFATFEAPDSYFNIIEP
ncbi:MAG: MBL fold metallo-hydrolase [Parabacteroides sp.]|nr:MBL fold metallo-hydrolase [Parabacteroides sp.]